MGCVITKGRGYFCGGQVGGIKKAYLLSFYSTDVITAVTTDADGDVTAVTTASGNPATFFEFDLDRQASSFNQTIVTGNGGAVAYQSDLDLKMSHDNPESWLEMQNVVEGLWQILIEDNNGVFYLLGVKNGVQVVGGTYAHGGDVAYGDYVGYEVQMQGAEPIPAYNMGANPSGLANISFSASQYDHS